jgi:hypothetical protein
MDRHNERIKWFATTLSNLGVAAIIAGVVAPSFNGSVGDPVRVGAWFAFGASMIWVAYDCLGGLR